MVHVPSERHVYQRANVDKMVYVPRKNDIYMNGHLYLSDSRASLSSPTAVRS